MTVDAEDTSSGVGSAVLNFLEQQAAVCFEEVLAE